MSAGRRTIAAMAASTAFLRRTSSERSEAVRVTIPPHIVPRQVAVVQRRRLPLGPRRPRTQYAAGSEIYSEAGSTTASARASSHQGWIVSSRAMTQVSANRQQAASQSGAFGVKSGVKNENGRCDALD